MGAPRRALALLLLAGCASLPPLTIVVADKEERSRLEREFRGLRTTETGQVAEVRRDVVVHEYWIKDTEGRWHRVDEATWRAARVGEPLTIPR